MIKIEFISFKIAEIKQNLQKTPVWAISLDEDANQLNEVVIRSEKNNS
jgi:hypothetical protein